ETASLHIILLGTDPNCRGDRVTAHSLDTGNMANLPVLQRRVTCAGNELIDRWIDHKGRYHDPHSVPPDHPGDRPGRAGRFVAPGGPGRDPVAADPDRPHRRPGRARR